jgi:hypothetical protein
MNAHQSSTPSTHPALHMLAPAMPVRDNDDLRLRVRNFHTSMKACPSCWRNYFEVLASAVEREAN